MITDQVIINRLFPASEGYWSQWALTQAKHAAEIQDYFQPVPVAMLPMFADEVVGISRLQEVAEALYHGADPAQFYVQEPPYAFTKEGAAYTLVLHVPFVHKEEITMTRQQEDVVVRIGAFKRHVPLPRAIARLKTAGAKLEGDRLVIRFVEEGRA